MSDEFQFPELPPELKEMMKSFDQDFKSEDLKPVYNELEEISKDMAPAPQRLNVAISCLSSDIINDKAKFLYGKLTVVEVALIADICHDHIRLGQLMQKYIDKEGGD